MHEVFIKIPGIDETCEFVDLTDRYPFKIELIYKHYIVDGKSIMDIFTLDFNTEIKLRADCGADSPLFDDIKKFIV